MNALHPTIPYAYVPQHFTIEWADLDPALDADDCDIVAGANAWRLDDVSLAQPVSIYAGGTYKGACFDALDEALTHVDKGGERGCNYWIVAVRKDATGEDIAIAGWTKRLPIKPKAEPKRKRTPKAKENPASSIEVAAPPPELTPADTFERISLDLIHPNPNQPRKRFDPEALAELAVSIQRHGLMQPITVTPRPDGQFMIVAGERRWRAHQMLAEQNRLDDRRIAAHVRTMDDMQVAINAIVENLHRADISPIEEAHAFQSMVDQGMTAASLAKTLGVRPAKVRERLALNNLNPEIQTLVQGGQLQLGAALEIAKLEPRDQNAVVRSINAGRLKTVKQIAAAVRAVIDREIRPEMFSAPVMPKDEAAMTRLEKKIEAIVSLAEAGFKDGDCKAAARVSKGRAAKVADQLALVRRSLEHMEKQLRAVAAHEAIVQETQAML